MFSDNFQQILFLDAEDVEVVFDCAKDGIVESMESSGTALVTVQDVQSAIIKQIEVHLQVNFEEIHAKHQ